MRDTDNAKSAPIGMASLVALAIVTLCSLAFHFFSMTGALAEKSVVMLIVVAYLPFSPAVASSLYSMLFERPKVFGLVSFSLAVLIILTGRESIILLDGLLLLPFWFLAAVGIAKFVKRRTGANPESEADEAGQNRQSPGSPSR